MFAKSNDAKNARDDVVEGFKSFGDKLVAFIGGGAQVTQFAPQGAYIS